MPDLVMFFMKQDKNRIKASIDNPTDLSYIRVWEVDIVVYGESCNKIASIIKQAQQLPKAISYLITNNFALGDFEGTIESADMIINSQWFPIRKYRCKYHEKINISLPHLAIDEIENVGEININKGD